MDRFAVFVDAGYFFAAGGTVAFGVTQRIQLNLPRPRQCVEDIIARTSFVSDSKSLLRVYWYDALIGATPTVQQATLAHLPGVKLRLGVVNRTGEQKGVDSLIVTDLIDLARNRAIADAVLVSGDEDLRIAVQVAQSYGVRVHVFAAGEPNRSVSSSLQMEADSVHVLDKEWFEKHFALVSAERLAPCGITVPGAPTDVITELNIADAAEKAINEIFDSVNPEDIAMLAELLAPGKYASIPSEYDGKLITCTAAYAQRTLLPEEKRQIRGIFKSRVRERNAPTSSPRQTP